MKTEIKYLALVASFLLSVLPIEAQKTGTSISSMILGEKTDPTEARNALCSGEYEQAVTLYGYLVEKARSNRSAGKGVGGDLLGEYALALALSGQMELALVNADRARLLGAANSDWYSAQVLSLAGEANMAQALPKGFAPTWIPYTVTDYLATLVPAESQINFVVQPSDLRRFIALQNSGQITQALSLMGALLAAYHDVPAVQGCYSDLCEQLGNYDLAAQHLRKAIALMPVTDPERPLAEQHARQLDTQLNRQPQPMNWIARNQVRFIWYFGGSVAKKLYAVNTRFGLYARQHWSASANLGANIADENVTGNVGLSGYYTLNFFVLGAGLTYQFGKNINNLSFSPSVGLTFLNASQTSSFDVTIGAHVPFVGSGKTSVFLSIGKTFYFDFNPKFKKQ